MFDESKFIDENILYLEVFLVVIQDKSIVTSLLILGSFWLHTSHY